MDRAFTYVGEQLKAIDIARTNTFAMIGIGKLASAILGDGVSLNDLTCVPTGPASLNVLLNPGEIYHLENVDNSDFGPMPTNTAQQIVKCGQLLSQQTFAITPPGTVGQSIDYLIQVQYLDDDILPENRPFFEASPQTVDTVRSGLLSATLKPGLPATTGSQIPPSPDAGYTGAWVITVANGQTQIIAGDITEYSGAPFIIDKLKDKISEAEGDVRYPLAASFDNTIAGNGYQKFPGGLMFQWFTVGIPVVAGANIATVTPTFPTAFDTECLHIFSNIKEVAGTTRGWSVDTYGYSTTGFTSNFTASTAEPFGANATIPIGFLAIGY